MMPKKKPAKKKGMDPKLFEELQTSIGQSGKIMRGEMKPARVTIAGEQPDGSWIMRDPTAQEYAEGFAERRPPKRAPKPKLRKDAAETAWAVVQAAIGEGPRPEPPCKRVKESRGGQAR